VPPAPRAFLARHPWAAFLWRWGVSLASLALGLATLFVFRRGLPHVAWIAGYVLLAWLVFAALALLRAALLERGRHLVLHAGEYALQTLSHNLFLFVLPSYYASATLTSVNAVFLAGLAAGAIVTAVDPWYARAVRPHPVVRAFLLALANFAALSVALPLIGVRPFWAMEGAALLAMLALAPAFAGGSWRRAALQAGVLAVCAALLAWYGRAAIPPAPLFVARAVAARAVVDLDPVDPIDGSVPAEAVREWGQLAAYTAVYAPGGLREEIAHAWSRDGVPIARIRLSPVRGGRAEGFRTFSVTRNLGPKVDGHYRVDVVTASGQLVGRLSFTVTP